jgi:hypothetical protein
MDLSCGPHVVWVFANPRDQSYLVSHVHSGKIVTTEVKRNICWVQLFFKTDNTSGLVIEVASDGLGWCWWIGRKQGMT